jgi:hypothetical protein
MTRQVRIPPSEHRFDTVFVAFIPSCMIGWSDQPAHLGSAWRPPRPTGPSLQECSVVPPLSATTTRSARLDDSRGFPRIAGYTAALCPTTWSGLPPRPSLLWVSAPYPARHYLCAERRNGDTPETSPLPRAFRNRTVQQLLHFPDTSFRRGCADDGILFACCDAPQGCSPLLDWSDLRDFSGRRGLLRPSLPEASHQHSESGMTIQCSVANFGFWDKIQNLVSIIH